MDFIRILFAILIALKKLHVFKTAFLCQTNDHLVLIILIRRGKFVLSFLDFYLFFCKLFCFRRNIKKKHRARPGRGPAEPAGPSRAVSLARTLAPPPSPRRARHRRRLAPSSKQPPSYIPRRRPSLTPEPRPKPPPPEPAAPPPAARRPLAARRRPSPATPPPSPTPAGAQAAPPESRPDEVPSRRPLPVF